MWSFSLAFRSLFGEFVFLPILCYSSRKRRDKFRRIPEWFLSFCFAFSVRAFACVWVEFLHVIVRFRMTILHNLVVVPLLLLLLLFGWLISFNVNGTTDITAIKSIRGKFWANVLRLQLNSFTRRVYKCIAKCVKTTAIQRKMNWKRKIHDAYVSVCVPCVYRVYSNDFFNRVRQISK